MQQIKILEDSDDNKTGVLETKFCTACKTEKPVSDFYVRRTTWSNTIYQHMCKPCRSTYSKQQHMKNPEKRKERNREYLKENREKVYAINSRWLSKNKDKVAKHHSKWRKEVYKPREVELRIARHAAKYGSVGFHTSKDFEKLLRRYNGKCAYCGENDATDRDHVIPLSKGGSNYIGNILPACRICNSSKKERLLSHWRNLPNTRLKRWCF